MAITVTREVNHAFIILYLYNVESTFLFFGMKG